MIDSHCHIQCDDYPDGVKTLDEARKANVTDVLVVGVDIRTSKEALEFAKENEHAYAVIGIHPHETKKDGDKIAELEDLIKAGLSSNKLVGIGEIGLDYHYNHSSKDIQQTVLEKQIKLAIKYNLPISFHVREAFSDFWPIYLKYKPRGVLHSYTDNKENLKKALDLGLYIGVNGICTFSNSKQLAVYKEISLDRILLETDAPYLTPVPFRGKVNKPSFTREVLNFLAKLRQEDPLKLDEITANNTRKLYRF